MTILVTGTGQASELIATRFAASGTNVERCACTRAARERLERADVPYSMVMLVGTPDPAELVRIRRHCVSHPGTLVTLMQPLEPLVGATEPCAEDDAREGDDAGQVYAAEIQAADAETTELDAGEVEHWRNVLTFAKRSPDTFPALGQALRGHANVFQYHAPPSRRA